MDAPSSLIITGDDFGRSHAINEAIEAHHQAGFLTQASLMIHEPFAEEAVRIARRNPGLCVGLHLTLCAAARSGASPLTDATGNFEPRPGRAGWRYFWDRRLETALQAEIREQFERFAATRLPAVYWDGHTHLHLHPTIFRLTLPLAWAAGFRAVRLVQTDGCGSLGWIFHHLSRSAGKTGLHHSDRLLGLAETGKMDGARMSAAISRSGWGPLTEIYYHPGLDGHDLDFPRLLDQLARQKIRLANWRSRLVIEAAAT